MVDSKTNLAEAEKKNKTHHRPYCWEHWLRNSLMKEVAAELQDLAAPLKDCLDAQSVKRV